MGQRSPSCVCCGCLSYSTTWPTGFGIGDEWEQVSGEWGVASGTGRVFTQDDSALLIHTTEWTETLAFGVTGRNIRYGTRAIFGYLDIDNYLFVEQLVAGRTVCGSRIAGVETIVSSAPQIDPPVNGDPLLTTADPYHADSFLFCYSGDLLAAKWIGGAIGTTQPPSWSTADWLGQIVTPLPGRRVGFGTTTITPAGAAAVFSPAVVYESASDTKPDCLTCAEPCCDGPVPIELLLTIEGTYTGNTPSYPAENAVAAALAGSYTITNATGYSCFWQYVYGAGPNNWSLWKTGDSLLLRLFHGSIRNQFGGSVAVAMQFFASGVDTRCANWFDDLELTLDFAHVDATDSPRALVRLP